MNAPHVKLSNTMTAVLRKIAERGPRNAYLLGAGMNTLRALEKRGLAKTDRTVLGAFFSPNTALVWRITPAGRAALNGKK